ncbi:flagellar hook assembly protein FlgD [Rhizobium sp. LjRoot254]|uniref:flagellar hook assembly protein FlgD n=1 Tax=Rhizobium sp. LjRoot254 TaxID=3342297 RepID=UPI003ECF3DB0
MAVDAVNNVTTTPVSTPKTAATTDAKEATLNYDSFLKLLVAQMKNQDPTDPIDASEQMSQLATFSGVEQAIKTNTHLESLIQETSLSQAASMIGKTITSADGETTGVVKSVAVKSDGLTATLENGDTVVIQSGISVSATPTTPDTNTPDNGEDTGNTPDDGQPDETSSAGE